MYSIESLKIQGARNEAVPNAFYRQQQQTAWLAVVLPGLAYTTQMPLLYYATRMLLARGADVLCVDYAYNRRPDLSKLSGQEQADLLQADVIAAYDAAFAQRAYARASLVGKSLGTLGMGHLLVSRRRLPALDCVWITPLLKNPALLEQIRLVPRRSLFVAGTADSTHDPERLAEAQSLTGGTALLIEGADHSLEAAPGVARSLQALQDVMGKLREFLDSAVQQKP